jgi:hypothetical protein
MLSIYRVKIQVSVYPTAVEHPTTEEADGVHRCLEEHMLINKCFKKKIKGKVVHVLNELNTTP